MCCDNPLPNNENSKKIFEGQDVLIPWVKPEVKGNAPGKSLSVSSEPETERHSCRSGFRSVDTTDASTPGRRRRPECSNRLGSAGEKYRSKSLGDEGSARDVCRDLAIGRGYFGSQTLVEFYQRVSKTREFRVAKKYSTRMKNAISVDKSKHVCPNGEDGEDGKTVSKWPGQLVSECRKLGKFLRSLSSRSNSQGDGEADQIDFAENVSDVHSDCQLHCNANQYTNMATKSTEEARDTSRYGTVSADNYNAENTSTTTVKQLEQHRHTQDNYHHCCDPAIPIASSCAVSCSDLSLPSVISSGSCQVYNNNAAVAMASDDITYHSIPSTFSGSNHTKDSQPMAKMSRLKTTKSVSSLETISTLSHEENRFETTVNDQAGAQSTLISDICLDENKIDMFNNHAQSLCDTAVEAPSQSWMPLSRSESFNSEDSVSSNSDTTIMDSQVSDITNILAQRSENAQKLISTQDQSLNCGDAPKEPFGSLTETPTCVSKGTIDKGLNVQDLNRCLPKCQNNSHAIVSEIPNFDHKQLVEGSNNPGPVRFIETAKMIEGLSEMSDYLESCSAVSLDRTKPVDSSTVQYNVLAAISGSHTTNHNNSDLHHGCRDEGGADINIDKTKGSDVKRDKMLFQETHRVAQINERKTMLDTTLQQEVVPFRGTLKTFLHKLTDYFRPHSKHGSNKFGCYHNGKSAARRYVFDSDSSDVEISPSSFSSHSSCYPGLFATSRERDSCEKADDISQNDPYKNGTGNYDDDFETVDDVQTPVDDIRTNTDKVTDKLNISVFNNEENCRQDFVNDVSEIVVEHAQDKAKNTPDDHYVFKVENISQIPVKKSSFLNSLSRKWSRLFDKRPETDCRKHGLHDPTASVSSSSDDNNERLKISLKDNQAVNLSEEPSQKDPLRVRRPNSLDFGNKRTRRCGRRPAPQKDHIGNVTQNSKDMDGRNRIRRFQENEQLSLSDAMTLLGDGVAEERIVKRLDNSAKSIFAEMKRINFAMRQFPMSSLDNSSKEVITKETVNTDNNDEEATNARHRTLKMRRSKKIFSSHRGFSESIAAQDNTKIRRKHFHGFKDAHGIDLTNVPCLDKKCVSEDFQISFDRVGGQICKSKCQILYSCNSDSKPELQLPSGNQLVSLKNRTNNAHVAPEDSISADPCENAQQGTTPTLRSAKELVDTENTLLSKYDTRTNHHSDDMLAAQSFNTPHERSERVHRLDERTPVVNVLSKDSSSNQEKDVKCTPRNSSNDNQQPTSVTSHMLKHKPSRRSNKPRTLYQESAAADSNTDNSLSRYYHVFKQGELDHLVTRYVPSLTIVETFYDHANWCIIAEKLSVP